MDGVSGNAECCSGGVSWVAEVTVRVHDGNGANVSGATVAGQWSGAHSGSSSGITNAGGDALVVSPLITGPSVTFTVTNVTHPNLTYDPSRNTETSVTIEPDDDDDDD